MNKSDGKASNECRGQPEVAAIDTLATVGVSLIVCPSRVSNCFSSSPVAVPVHNDGPLRTFSYPTFAYKRVAQFKINLFPPLTCFLHFPLLIHNPLISVFISCDTHYKCQIVGGANKLSRLLHPSQWARVGKWPWKMTSWHSVSSTFSG